MPDIQLRFNKDMLVLSAPVAGQLAAHGVDVERDLEYLNLVEPESIADILRMQLVAGAQCLVANTAGLTPAALLRGGLEGRGAELATAALAVARACKPQHLLAEIAFCGLPFDGSSAASLKEHCAQYTRAARFFDGQEIDAFLLSEFTDLEALKCAIIGMRKVTDVPLFAALRLGPDATLAGGRQTVAQAAAMMQEYEAAVCGLAVQAPLETLLPAVREAAAACDLPLLVQVDVAQVNKRQGGPTAENPFYCADAFVDVAAQLRAAGVQFLRAGGAATPAYTGVLAATTAGFDVVAGA